MDTCNLILPPTKHPNHRDETALCEQVGATSCNSNRDMDLAQAVVTAQG